MEEFKKQRSLKGMPTSSRDALLDSSSSSEKDDVDPTALPAFAVGDMVDAKFADDGIFYEASVEKVYPDGSYMVIFAGYGNSQRCFSFDLRRREARVADAVPQKKIVKEEKPLWEIPEADFEKKSESEDQPSLKDGSPTLMKKFISFFGGGDEEEEEEEEAANEMRALEPKKQAFFDDLFSSQNLDLSGSSSDIFGLNNK